jgi:oligopeptide transport system permease protein
MWFYVLRRVLVTLPTLLAVITVCYFLLHFTPGGPFDSERKVSDVMLKILNEKYLLDRPLYEQYFHYLGNLLRGDLGASFRYEDWTVNQLVAKALPVSMTIGGIAMLISIVLGISLGMIAALRQNSIVDYLVMLLGSVGKAFPSFIIGPVLVLIFAIWLKWLPAGGWNDFNPKYMILPVCMLVLLNVAEIARVMRGSLIEVLSSNFIRTARAKGLPIRTIVLRHALKPALLPVVSLAGPLAISVMTEAIVTESVFSLPGLGRLIVNGAGNRDYTLVLGLVVLITFVAVIFNLIVDLLYACLDPKIRYR